MYFCVKQICFDIYCIKRAFCLGDKDFLAGVAKFSLHLFAMFLSVYGIAVRTSFTYTVLYHIYCITYTVSRILYHVYCITYFTVSRILYHIYCSTHTVSHILYHAIFKSVYINFLATVFSVLAAKLVLETLFYTALKHKYNSCIFQSWAVASTWQSFIVSKKELHVALLSLHVAYSRHRGLTNVWHVREALQPRCRFVIVAMLTIVACPALDIDKYYFVFCLSCYRAPWWSRV